MNYAVIVAGGIGSRMGAELPKQFLEVGGKPILVHSVLKFANIDEIERIVVLTPAEWLDYAKTILAQHLESATMRRVDLVAGGETRNETIMNAIDFIEAYYGLDDETVVITHDAVRPCVTEEIIRGNIEAVKKYGAANTAVPATDTILQSAGGEVIDAVPNRSELFNCQTPQTFLAMELRETYLSLSDEEKASLTDATKIYVLKGKPVKLVMGSYANIKITYPEDLQIAEALLTKTSS